jgi:hypothetical protein
MTKGMDWGRAKIHKPDYGSLEQSERNRLLSDEKSAQRSQKAIAEYMAGRCRLTKADIEAGKSAKGGFTRAILAEWGVPWPPPKGWRKRLLQQGYVPKNAEKR